MTMTRPAALVAAVACASPCAAQTAPPRAPEPTITVVGQRDPLHLDRPAAAASRLPLTLRETPASVEVLTQDDLQARGLRTAREAFDGVVGAVAGNVPGNPAVVSLRGFAGNAVSILQDGVRIAASTIVQRDTSSWHYDRIEVLKGPASVLHGEGALGGVIDKVTRKPVLGERRLDLLLTGGSFDTTFAGAGVNLPVAADVAVRADASYQRSDSLYDVEDNRSFAAGLTASALFRPSETASLLVAVDHFEDRYTSTYQGLPLIPAAFAKRPSDAVRSSGGLVADRSMRRRNFNPQGAYSGADETTVRSRLDWRVGGGWSVALDLAGYTADRAFLLVDTQTFVAPTAALPAGGLRQSFQDFRHDHRYWNARGVVANDGRFAGMRNRLSIGAEVNHTDFVSLRRQAPAGALPMVDLRRPDTIAPPTTFAGDVTFDSRLRQVSVFAEDALNLTPRWLLVGGVRWDRIDLDRATIQNRMGQNRTGATERNAPRFDPVSWRGGTTWEALPELTLYAQYTTAVSPVSSILLASIANSRFRLTTGRAVEAGFKASGWGGRASLTGAVYRIGQRDILTRDPVDPSLTVQGGRQSSRGVEITGVVTPIKPLRLSVGASYTDARYDELVENVGGVAIERGGNRPINVPATTLDASAIWSAGGVSIGGFVRHAGRFFTDTANTTRVAGHAVFDASVSVPLSPPVTASVRGRNLWNAFYGEYSGYPSTNVYIGAPRSFEIALASRF